MRSASAPAGDQPRAPRALPGAVAGVLAAAVAIGAAQLVAGLTAPASSPVLAVGQAAIDLTPLPVKDFAISAFGTEDKTVLLGGILVVLALYAAVVGIVAVRRLAFGMWGLGLFAFIGLWAALTRPGSTADYLWPTLAGAAAGAFTLARLADAAGRLSALPARPRLAPAPIRRRQARRCQAGPAPEMLTPPDLPVPPAERFLRPRRVLRPPSPRSFRGGRPHRALAGPGRAPPSPFFPTLTTRGRPAGPHGGGSWSAAG